jgi:hypothetical protein
MPIILATQEVAQANSSKDPISKKKSQKKG